jgi:hypothetical protein
LEGGISVVFKVRVVGVGGVPFLHSVLFLMYRRASYDMEIAPTLGMF